MKSAVWLGRLVSSVFALIDVGISRIAVRRRDTPPSVELLTMVVQTSASDEWGLQSIDADFDTTIIESVTDGGGPTTPPSDRNERDTSVDQSEREENKPTERSDRFFPGNDGRRYMRSLKIDAVPRAFYS